MSITTKTYQYNEKSRILSNNNQDNNLLNFFSSNKEYYRINISNIEYLYNISVRDCLEKTCSKPYSFLCFIFQIDTSITEEYILNRNIFKNINNMINNIGLENIQSIHNLQLVINNKICTFNVPSNSIKLSFSNSESILIKFIKENNSYRITHDNTYFTRNFINNISKN
tara:strand:+ start:1144 stop:1650 length:507 start_codon:yes stop_codon:yes gene_type:complete